MEQANTHAPSTANVRDSSTKTHASTLGENEPATSWGDAVKSQLSRIAEFATTNGAPTADRPLLSDFVEMIDPDKLSVNEIYDDEPIKVVEIRAPDPLSTDSVIRVGPDEFIRRFQQLLFVTNDPKGQAVHFKLYGIRWDGTQLKTRQRMTARESRGGKEVQSHTVVEAAWLTPEDQPPRLVSFYMPTLVQNEIASGSSALFEDITSSVVGDNQAWSEQLRLGMNTWARRIDRSLKPDFLGYHGLAVGDVDGDGFEDIYLCQPGGLPNLLFRQRSDGTLVDISNASGVDWLDNSTGALLVDLDNDGDADLSVATQRAFLIMENDGGGKFILRTKLPNVGLGYSPTAADYDLDGDLDLLVLRYAADSREIGDFPTPHPFHNARNGGANVLLENERDFRFKDVTKARGLGTENHRFSFAASWEDFDNDGDVDLYIANDFGPNHLFRNDRGSFVDVSNDTGTQDWGFGMSATWADYDRDGNMDLYVSSMFSGAGNQVVPQPDFNPTMPDETRRKYLKMVRGNSLLRNVGHGRFVDVTNVAAEGYGGWAWGAKFADLNNDGWEDLYVANGYISQPDKQDL